jgi:hypothetical protein
VFGSGFGLGCGWGLCSGFGVRGVWGRGGGGWEPCRSTCLGPWCTAHQTARRPVRRLGCRRGGPALRCCQLTGGEREFRCGRANPSETGKVGLGLGFRVQGLGFKLGLRGQGQG